MQGRRSGVVEKEVSPYTGRGSRINRVQERHYNKESPLEEIGGDSLLGIHPSFVGGLF
jgi:hypothetical protein